MAKFLSRFAAHRLVIKPSIPGKDGAPPQPGHSIQFVDGRYVTEDKKEIDFLRKHKDFDVFIFEEKEQVKDDAKS